MSKEAPFEKFDTDYLAESGQATKQFEAIFAYHKMFIVTSPLFSREEILTAYGELLNLFESVVTAGQMAVEAELITRDLTDIDPDQ